MSETRTAPKDYKCNHCWGVIHKGSEYRRRSEHNGIHYVTNKYHVECEQAHIDEQIEARGC